MLKSSHSIGWVACCSWLIVRVWGPSRNFRPPGRYQSRTIWVRALQCNRQYRFQACLFWIRPHWFRQLLIKFFKYIDPYQFYIMIELLHWNHLVIFIFLQDLPSNWQAINLYDLLINILYLLSMPSPLLISKAIVYSILAPKGCSAISSNSSKLGSLWSISSFASNSLSNFLFIPCTRIMSNSNNNLIFSL